MNTILSRLQIIKPLPLRTTAASIAAAAAILGSGFGAEAPFVVPDLEAKLFDGEKVDFGRKGKFDRVATINALAHIAGGFDPDDGVSNQLRAQALGIAGLIDPKNKTFKSAYEELEQNPEAAGNGKRDKTRLAGNIHDGVEFLLKDKDNEDNRKCAAYCVDVALRLDPNGRHAKKLHALRDGLGNDALELEWDKIKGKVAAKAKDEPPAGKRKPKRQPRNVPGQIPWDPFNLGRNPVGPVKEVMPGGKAEMFTTNQSSIFGLLVVQLNGGKHAGGASEIVATALKSNVEGVHFKLDQRVGQKMANSLNSIVQYLRVKYEGNGQVPDGYEVSIVFQDRDSVTDGPSAGTAMTLMLDTLFSGSQIDPKFACTGGITPNGSVTKIGGVAAKIRGATRRDCNIVGVPEGNAGGVEDIVVLGGIKQLTDIQVFTMKNFDQAYEISRAKKDAKVAAALSDFNKVAELLRTKGGKMLKNRHVQKKLQEVVKAMPNHMSAKLLLQYAKGKPPKKLSAAGSFHEINTRASGLLNRAGRMAMFNKYDHSEATVEDATEALKQLEEINGHVHPKFENFLETIATISVMVEQGADGKDTKGFLKKLRAKWTDLQTQHKKLRSDPELAEEMLG